MPPPRHPLESSPTPQRMEKPLLTERRTAPTTWVSANAVPFTVSLILMYSSSDTRAHIYYISLTMRINDSTCWLFYICGSVRKQPDGCVCLPLGEVVVSTTACQNDLLLFQRNNSHVVSQRSMSLAAAWLPLQLKPEKCRADGALDRGGGGVVSAHPLLQFQGVDDKMATGRVWWGRVWQLISLLRRIHVRFFMFLHSR